MTRADLIEAIAGEMPAHLAALSSGDPWDAAALAFWTVVGREPALRWGAISPSADAVIEDALVCWDVGLMAQAMTMLGLEA